MMDVRGLKVDVHKCESSCCTGMFGTVMVDRRDRLNYRDEDEEVESGENPRSKVKTTASGQ